jgi:excisionase family DNA binding protein
MPKYIRDYPDVLTVEDVKEILQIGRKTAYRLIDENKIQHFRIGTKIRIPKQCLVNYLNKHGAKEESLC